MRKHINLDCPRCLDCDGLLEYEVSKFERDLDHAYGEAEITGLMRCLSCGLKYDQYGIRED